MGINMCECFSLYLILYILHLLNLILTDRVMADSLFVDIIFLIRRAPYFLFNNFFSSFPASPLLFVHRHFSESKSLLLFVHEFFFLGSSSYLLIMRCLMVYKANHLQNNLAAEKICRGGDRANLSCLFIKIFIFLLGSSSYL